MFSDAQLDALNAGLFIAAFLSFCGSSVIILSYLLFKELRLFGHRLILGLSINDWITSLCFFVLTANTMGHGKQIEKGALCDFQAFFGSAFVYAADAYTLVIALHVYWKVVVYASSPDQKTPIERHEKIAHSLVMGWSVFMGILPMIIPGEGYHVSGNQCWVTKHFYMKVIVAYGLRWATLIIISILYTHVLITKRATLIPQKENPAIKKELEKKIRAAHCNGKKSTTTGISNVTKVEEAELEEARKSDSKYYVPSGDGEEQENEKQEQEKEQEQDLSAAQISARLDQVEKEMTRETSEMKNKISRRLTMQMILFPMVYFLVWIVSMISDLYVAVEHKVSFTLLLIKLFTFPSQGFWNAIVYGWAENLPCYYRKKFGHNQ